jgi:hypothetical protein
LEHGKAQKHVIIGEYIQHMGYIDTAPGWLIGVHLVGEHGNGPEIFFFHFMT